MQSKNYEYTEKMGEISGFGGEYEQACRNMVIAGLKWCDKKPNAILDYKEYANVYGITCDESPDMKECQQAMLKAPLAKGCTGAMMQACMSHIMFIKKNGWDKYVEEMSKEETESK